MTEGEADGALAGSSRAATPEAVRASFDEVLTACPIGVAVSDTDGRLVRVNPALERLLGSSAGELSERTIQDVFHPDDADHLSAAYRELVDGPAGARIGDRRRLLRADGTDAWVHLCAAVRRDSSGEPVDVVTMVEDITELRLLQERFQHQALHDALTGLPNRQFFRSRLETLLVKLPPESRVALYHLGLDGFELINDGLGYEVGDALIKTVARRLEQLVANEEAIVARFGGTEFALLVREQHGTPQVPELAREINELLAEPVYVSGRGIAASASVGVVRRRVGEIEATDLLWSADVALRQADAAGKRQWALFDPDGATEERTEARLAAVMPGGLEMGEFEVVYRPQRLLDGGELASLEAELRWDADDGRVVEHRDCQRLAERSGVTLSLRDWVLRTAWNQLAEWHREGHRVRLSVSLSPNQAQDPDLAAVVHDVLDHGELEPRWLRLSAPVAAISGDEEARENLRNLGARGVRAALHEFCGSPADLRLLRELPIASVHLAAEAVRLAHEARFGDVAEVRALRSLVPMIRSCGVRIWVPRVETEEQAARWREMGCEVVEGACAGEPAPSSEVPERLFRT
ncbi:putative bifunctional diguanylate cyclase/phosphodiesterase [Saccharopolyspora griseoalba]|uniref:Bifunctional diguanylate cyclase/phosphodiesterase n=1 Tax=Saccharopolyspora griseoalba TaxID=1431848 RepID=A0ABW2LPN9_9PSEU